MWNNNNNNNWGNNQGGGWGGNRNPYGGGASQPAVYSQATSMTDRSSLVTKVMWFTSFSIIAAMAGAWTGAFQLKLTSFSGGTWILMLIAEIGLMIGAFALRERSGINFVMLYGFTFVTGLTISPIIHLLTDTGNGGIIIQALGATAGLTVALSFYAWTTKRDFSGFGPYLFVAVIGLVIVGLLNMFFHSAMLQSVIMYAGVLIFSFYLIFDVQRTKNFQNTVGNAIALTISIYLDILNLFLFILQILLSFRD
ncbi:MAG: Bax inhibitor-1/YccA family protein [Chloroflexota bacterium]|nr:Bax inhibitor-1/YccA family protein [Chloroflexota bacterium]